ncbi:putative acetyltransferase [Brachybacterium nesterenkovii]|uniref:Histone acetyltransferase Rv0428c-like SH3 domain-containing protein n=1 Tax=Brachybacterium nesterenkovii TaxID=47847 RepID=A0A1X6X000_9MICO|nr:acetyltransferase [Brachybacterium nesterenkovii]SLM91488.1 hypothetical protein FM110_06635 [Brachybacterium nesterenkovii]
MPIPDPDTPESTASTPVQANPATSSPARAEPDAHAPLPRPGWAPFLVPGVRVVLRYRIDPDASPHGESVTDALGYIESVDDDTVTVMTKRGAARVVRGLVVAAKQVPPPPVRRRPAPPQA